MSERPVKTVDESYTMQVRLLNQSDMNGYNRLFGGQLLMWMDEVAGITARRHAGCNVTTACIEKLDFKAAAYANDIITVTGHVVQVGRTSMTVMVHVYLEVPGEKRKLINEAHFVMVALDKNEKPTEVPDLVIDTDKKRRQLAFANYLRDTLK